MAEERRLVTVMFADVSGSTALGEALDPEDIRALLARFYAIAKEVIAGHGGMLEKFIGDAVMAVFGLPQAHGDDAQRALAAALELRERIKADSVLSTKLPIRIGLNTGEVVATKDAAARDFLVTGDAVNTAARLQQVADPWAILCSERSARAGAMSFAFGSPIAISLKGKTQPISAVPLIARTAPLVRRRIPLVGRDTDLAQLELVARRAFTERRPFLVSLIAPAGTGKTRLVEELLERLPNIVPQATVAIAQCLPYGQRLTYWPLRSVLFRLAGVSEDAEPAVVRQALLHRLTGAGIPALERVAGFLMATVGLGETEVTDRDALFAAWRTALETSARDAPVVLVFEDLHWSSDSLLDLVEFVMQPRTDLPVLMIALARPELLDRRPTWGGGLRDHVSLGLRPLSDAAMAELVEYSLGEPVPGIIPRIVSRAEGNPFYAGEVVRSILERVPSLQDLTGVERALAALPDTVQATVLARLDLLEPEERHLLQLGSVFGRAFRIGGIAAIAPDLASTVNSLADHLARKDLIRPERDDLFAFRHILIREVAYQTLSRGERGRLHAAAGAWLEGRSTGREDAFAELIAYHYREAAILPSALAIDTSDTTVVRRQAVKWLTRAADVALAGAATGEAAQHLRAAIELAETDVLPDLYERLGLAISWGDAAVEAFQTALRLGGEAGRPADQQLRVLASLLTLYMRFQGSVTRPPAEEIARLRAEGRALVERTTDQHAIAAFLISEAFFPFWRTAGGAKPTPDELADAEAAVRRGLKIVERLGDVRLHSAALDGLASIQQLQGTWESVVETSRARLAFGERLDLAERMDAYAMEAWASAILGDLEEADRVSAEGLDLLQPGQVIPYALHLASWRTYALMLRGRWDEATAAGERMQQLWIESGITSASFSVRGFIAALDVARARRDERLIDQYRRVLKEILGSLTTDSPTARMRTYVDADLDALDEHIIKTILDPMTRVIPEYLERSISFFVDRRRSPSADALRQVLNTAATQRLQILQAQALRALGVSTKDPDALTDALEIFERTGAVPFAARARCERALLTRDTAELERGMLDLEALGDMDQLSRIEQAHRPG